MIQSNERILQHFTRSGALVFDLHNAKPQCAVPGLLIRLSRGRNRGKVCQQFYQFLRTFVVFYKNQKLLIGVLENERFSPSKWLNSLPISSNRRSPCSWPRAMLILENLGS